MLEHLSQALTCSRTNKGNAHSISPHRASSVILKHALPAQIPEIQQVQFNFTMLTGIRKARRETQTDSIKMKKPSMSSNFCHKL